MNTPLSRTRPPPRRGLSRIEAAARCGLSAKQFNALVRENIFPAPRDVFAFMNRLEEIAIKPDRIDPGHVYFMEMGAFIKIGWSMSPHVRIDALQIASPYEIKILATFPGSLAQEASAHVLFATARGRGEWFRRSPGLLAYIEWMKIRVGRK